MRNICALPLTVSRATESNFAYSHSKHSINF